MRRTKEQAEKTKQSILDAGLNVFARRGFAKATLEEIADEAGVTRGAIYWHFKDKVDLFRQINEQEELFLSQMIDSIVTQRISPFVKIHDLLDAVIDNFYERNRFRQYIELTWYKMNLDHYDEIMESKITFVQNFLQLLEDLITESIQAGEINRNIDVNITALSISCLINGFYRLYFAAPDRARSKEKTKLIFKNYLGSITTDALGYLS